MRKNFGEDKERTGGNKVQYKAFYDTSSISLSIACCVAIRSWFGNTIQHVLVITFVSVLLCIPIFEEKESICHPPGLGGTT